MTLQADKPQRLLSLDAFRGITIAGMILVNNPGSWGRIYSPLEHAEWNGLTPTDLVFPFFLFIVGVAITLAFARRIEQGATRTSLIAQVARRSAILILLGLSMFATPNSDPNRGGDVAISAHSVLAGGFDWRLFYPFVLAVVGLALMGDQAPPSSAFSRSQARSFSPRQICAWLLVLNAIVWFVLHFQYFDASHLRVPGVLQRIGLCYFLASLIVLRSGVTGRAAWAVVLILGYWALVQFVHPPAEYLESAAKLAASRPTGLLHDWIDARLLVSHLYSERPDPEGLLSTLPAIATVLCGVLTGDWLRAKREPAEKLLWLMIAGAIAMFAGLWIGLSFPLNKKIWSSSYVLATAGIAMQGLAICYWLIDVKGIRRWATPFVMFGSNAIVIFVASSMTAKMLGRWRWTMPDGSKISAGSWAYKHLFVPWAGEMNGSLFFAITYVLLWLVVASLLYRRRVFVKI